jgi:hypothetical protein
VLAGLLDRREAMDELHDSTVQSSAALSVRGRSVSVCDSMVGVVAGPQVQVENSLVIVGIARSLSGGATVLIGRSALLGLLVATVLSVIVHRLFRRR